MDSKDGDQEAEKPKPRIKEAQTPDEFWHSGEFSNAPTEPLGPKPAPPAQTPAKKPADGDRAKGSGKPTTPPAPAKAPVTPSPADTTAKPAAPPPQPEKQDPPQKKTADPVNQMNAGADAPEVAQAKQAQAQRGAFKLVQTFPKSPEQTGITLDPRPADGAPAHNQALAPTPPVTTPPPVAPLPPPALPPPVAQWKNLDPEDKTDPVPHELHEHRANLEGAWNMIAGSVRGRLHAHKGNYREDAYAFAAVNGWKIVALCDGAGTAKHARIVARLASEAAAESMRRSLHDYRVLENTAGGIAKETEVHLREFLTKAALDARTIVEREQVHRRCQTRDVNTTLLIMIHAPFKDGGLVGAFQIGDGAIGILTDDDACHVLGVADHGQYSSETRFLTDAGLIATFPDRVKFRFFMRPIRAIAVMCDGVSDDFFPEEKRLHELFIGAPIQELKMKIGDKVEPAWGIMHKERGILRDPQDGKALVDWLRYEKRGSSDDRTLVLLYRSPNP
ncbi:MAG: protein phosphatase 2C domain-containing protein [Planctomycetes bacterium]|nr:protein phosphatase 2C domain-containing protein [Planctomycetota bacterium]